MKVIASSFTRRQYLKDYTEEEIPNVGDTLFGDKEYIVTKKTIDGNVCTLKVIRKRLYLQTMGNVRLFDDLGRIYIPKRIREEVFGKVNVKNIPMEISCDNNGNIILKQYKEDDSNA